MLINENDAKNLVTLLIGLGNLLYSNETNRSICKDMDISSNFSDVNANDGTSEDLELISELKGYLFNVLIN
jgi:hypothetical protein